MKREQRATNHSYREHFSKLVFQISSILYIYIVGYFLIKFLASYDLKTVNVKSLKFACKSTRGEKGSILY